MKEETKTIGEQIVEINSKLEALDEEKGRLITLHTSLENEEKAVKEKEAAIEDRKDKRVKMEGSQQSQMISQRDNDLLPIDFESEEAAPAEAPQAPAQPV